MVNANPLTAETARAYDNAIGRIVELWKDNKEVSNLAKQMEILGKNIAKLRGAKETEDKKKARIVWQKATQQYWDLVWAIVEAKIDAGPPDMIEFDPAERLFIDFGHLFSEYTTANDAFFDLLAEPSAVDMYQYNRITDYIKENYSLIFGKTYTGPSGGVTLEEKLKRFNMELKTAMTRRRIAVGTLVASNSDILDKSEIDEMLNQLEAGLNDSVETDMRTKRVREAEKAERERIAELCKHYESAEKTFGYLLDSLERKLTGADDQKKEAAAAAVAAPSPESGEAPPPRDPMADFDPFAEIKEDVVARPPVKQEAPEEVEEVEEAAEDQEISDDELTGSAEDMKEEPSKQENAETLDQSLKIIQNVLALHDRTKFIAGLIVHVTNEAQRWKTRTEMAAKKYKGQGLPALKMELREGLNHKKDFMLLAARTARVDTSPLCQNKSKPISLKRAGEIMMDLTPLDPGMLRASRIRMYGIPRVIISPGQGLGAYDWEDNSLIIPMFGAVSDVKDFCFALGSFRWDNDEDRTLKDTYALLKVNKGKGIRALQEAFMNDYFLWISKERKGYR
ncbi:MAG: hypothetical protein LBT08_11525, partial [Synergistaceae bacterium]|nr:hypothetical protein [Synergistaceae bacterium]